MLATTTGVPQGPLRLRHDPTSFELVTIQHRDVYEALAADGIVHPDLGRSTLVELDEFATAYRWMAHTLAATRTTSPTFDPDSGAMFWLWAQTRRNVLVSDAKAYGHDHLLLRCRINRNRVLLSDFTEYHSILNGDVVYDADELAALEASIDTDYRTELEAELRTRYGPFWRHRTIDPSDQRRVEATWPAHLVTRPRRGQQVQACVAHLEYRDLVSVHELYPATARCA